jgi:hypothetical protein
VIRISGKDVIRIFGTRSMIEHGLDDHTVMSISGHSSTRMPERYTHPTVERKRVALETFDSVATNWPEELPTDAVQRKKPSEEDFFLSNFGLPTEARNLQEMAHLRALRYGGQPSHDIRAKVGGRQEARTPDLRVANAALSQLS